MKEHRDKLSIATKEFANVKLVYCEEYSNKYEAALREKQLKGWSKFKKQKLIYGELGKNVCTKNFLEVL